MFLIVMGKLFCIILGISSIIYVGYTIASINELNRKMDHLNESLSDCYDRIRNKD